jgi:glutaminyl-tRNA synthetase
METLKCGIWRHTEFLTLSIIERVRSGRSIRHTISQIVCGDSFENITHSLCTAEFIQPRVSYKWLNKSLDVYEPMQREYDRLNIAGTVLSKQKIAKLVNEGYVRGWDDPRLFTLIAIRRRGVPPGVTVEFVNELGVSTATTNIQLEKLDQTVRRYLERTVPRLALVLDPVPVIIEGAEEMELDIPFNPKIPAMGSHMVKFTKTVYIDRSDFREVDSKDYFRLAPWKVSRFTSTPVPSQGHFVYHRWRQGDLNPSYLR